MTANNGRGFSEENNFVSKQEYDAFVHNFLAWKAQVDVRLERMDKIEAEVSELKTTTARIDERTEMMQTQALERYRQTAEQNRQIATAIDTLVEKVSELSARQKQAPAD